LRVPQEHRTSDLVFGFIGRLSPEKGIEVLLGPAKNLKGTHWKLRIAGAGSSAYVKRLKEEYCDTRIEWLGFIDPAEFYKSVDVIVIPSIWAEPLGYVVSNSMATDAQQDA
jgi:glycosyltransferase involved in cell wall biosynthesis